MNPVEEALSKVREIDAEFADLMIGIYRRRWTGHVGLDFLNGIPRRAELPGVRVRLTQPSVDNGTNVADAVSVQGHVASRA